MTLQETLLYRTGERRMSNSAGLSRAEEIETILGCRIWITEDEGDWRFASRARRRRQSSLYRCGSRQELEGEEAPVIKH